MNKGARFVIKIYKNCESKTGYVYDFIIYTGKDNDSKNIKTGMGISGNVVKNYLEISVDKEDPFISIIGTHLCCYVEML